MAAVVLPALPLLVIVAALLLWPLGILVLQSVTVDGMAFSPANYLRILRSTRYLQSFINTAFLAIGSTLLALILCTPAAMYIEGNSGYGRKWLAVLLTIPLSLPGIVIGFFVILNLGLTGAIPKLIEWLTGERQFTVAYTFWGLLLGYVYFQIPRVVLVIRGSVASIDPDIIDTARTLGAPTWRVYTAIILPTLRPALLNAASLSLATAFGAYGTAATLSRGYRVIPLEIAAAFTESFQPGLAAAMSILLAFITSVILLSVTWFGDRRSYR